ncbi:MAG: 4Fe-4S binding protein [Candidatus Eisenbacteria bacterium]|uniref:4Fe-4S binding protein n=1 Tax=Eiseniibacteriota bacterium TaxID=2212470 RepID=A0A956LZY2_UNCEI|nr:4Fe-4S binding protein [Candidatus Eisenbacteria bacterium]
MSLLSLAQALRVSFQNLTRPKNTEPLPWKGSRERAERYRASFALVHDEHGEEACIGCMLCEKICPSQIISVTQGPKAPSAATGKPRGWCTDFTLDLNACIICELCVQVCPADAIIMMRVQEKPGFAREDLLLTMEKLYANEKLAKLTWATPTKLQEMQDPKPKRPEPVAAAPAKDAAPIKDAAPAAGASSAKDAAPGAESAPAAGTTPSKDAEPAKEVPPVKETPPASDAAPAAGTEKPSDA